MEDDNVVKPIDLDNNKSVPSADSTSHDFQCENCGLAFKDVSALKIHLKTHGIMRRHECGDCKKNFKTRLSLTIHMRSHTGERPYVCEVCLINQHKFHQYSLFKLSNQSSLNISVVW